MEPSFLIQDEFTVAHGRQVDMAFQRPCSRSTVNLSHHPRLKVNEFLEIGPHEDVSGHQLVWEEGKSNWHSVRLVAEPCRQNKHLIKGGGQAAVARQFNAILHRPLPVWGDEDEHDLEEN
jgi:hypothetical protein